MPPRAGNAQAILRMKTAATTAFALLALAAASSPARGVSAIRSSIVDRDFLHAHFQAHLLQRDWLPQPSSAFSSSSSVQHEDGQGRGSSPIAGTNSHEGTPPKKNKVLFVTAVYGDYEKTLKEPVQQQHPADFVAFTDRTDLASPTWQIRLVEDPLDFLVKHGGRVGVGGAADGVNTADAAVSADALDTAAAGISATTTTSIASVDGINSLTQNRHPFNLAKVFKMQFYRFFDLTEYRAAVWLDATIRIIGPQTAGTVFHLLAEQGRNLVTFEHNRRGLLSAEAEASKTEKYEGTHWGCCDQPFQNVTRQYEEYLQQGFSEKWWLEEYDAPMGISKRPEWGLWVTSFVAFDLHSPASFEFLDAWWRENVVHSTQDQVSFPFLAWKLKVYPFSLPSPGVSSGSWMHNDFFARNEHGMR